MQQHHRLLFGLASVTVSVASSEAQHLYQKGLAHLRRREVYPARSLLEQLRARSDGDCLCSLLQGHCSLMADGDPELAEAAYHRASASNGLSSELAAEVHRSFGRLWRMAARWEEAEESYAAAALQSESDDVAREHLFVKGKLHLSRDEPHLGVG